MYLCDFQMPFVSFMMLGLFSLRILVNLEVRMEKYSRNYIYLTLPHNVPQTPDLPETVGAQWPVPIMHAIECLEEREF